MGDLIRIPGCHPFDQVTYRGCHLVGRHQILETALPRVSVRASYTYCKIRHFEHNMVFWKFSGHLTTVGHQVSDRPFGADP